MKDKKILRKAGRVLSKIRCLESEEGKMGALSIFQILLFNSCNVLFFTKRKSKISRKIPSKIFDIESISEFPNAIQMYESRLE